MIIDAKTMFKKAEVAFEDFKKAMKKNLNSEFKDTDEAVAKGIFVNGYMKALDDLVKMSRS